MGVCSSCLGRDGDHDLSDEDEQTRLLFDDPHGSHYGSFGEQGAGTIQTDPQEVQRETEALQKIVTLTSNHLVDIFAMAPHNAIPPSASLSTATAAFPSNDARVIRYQDVVAKISTSDPSSNLDLLPADHTPAASDGWNSDEEEAEEMKGYTPVKSEGIGPLLGGFEDADSAMR